MGNILAIPITGMLAKYGFDGGWPSVFYCFGKYCSISQSAVSVIVTTLFSFYKNRVYKNIEAQNC